MNMSENSSKIFLDVITPEKNLAHTEVDSVELPGTLGRFEVLKDHAALLSSLTEGVITYRAGDQTTSLPVKSGFVEVLDNKVTACVETSEPADTETSGHRNPAGNGTTNASGSVSKPSENSKITGRP